MNKSKYYKYIIPYAAFLFATLKTGLNYEFSIIPALAVFITLVISYSKKITVSKIEFLVFFLAIITSISAIAYINANNIKEALFFLLISGGLIFARNASNIEICNLSTRIAKIYLFFGICDYFIPGFSELKASFLTRSFAAEEENLRGVSSLATEPSYYVLAIFSCWLIYFSANEFKSINIKFFIICIISLLLSKSSMAIIVVPLLVISLERKYRLFILISTGFGISLLFILGANVADYARAGQVISLLWNKGFNGILADESAGARFAFIIKDVRIAIGIFFLPLGPGSYDYIVSLFEINYLLPANFSSTYDITKSGSLFGRFLVEYGFIAILVMMFLLYRILLNAGFIRLSIIFIFIFIILIQMISLVYAPISFSLGVFLNFLLKRSGK